MFDWVTPPIAAFFGYFTGVLAAAAAMGAIYWVNIRLIEKRSERRRLGELASAAAAIRAELSSIQQTLKSAADKWRAEKNAAPIRASLSHHVQLFPQMGAVVAQFPEAVVSPVIKAYSLIADYDGFLYLHGVAPGEGAKRERFIITPEKARIAAKVNDSIARRIQQAIDALGDIEGAANGSSLDMSEDARALQVRRVGAKTPARRAAAPGAQPPVSRKAGKRAAAG